MASLYQNLFILYKARIKNESLCSIASKCGVHRNTVRNILNRFSSISNEQIIETCNSLCDSSCNLEESIAKLLPVRTPKVTKEELNAIERTCKEHLNCYLSPTDLCKKLSLAKGIDPEYVINYDIDSVDTNDYYGNERAEFRHKIYRIRDLTSPPKNYKEVYYSYYKNEPEYLINKISYECFYGYAHKYWTEPDWCGNYLGDVVDVENE